eukprot:8024200-Lingulodinium_polyedra.AAC.1
MASSFQGPQARRVRQDHARHPTPSDRHPCRRRRPRWSFANPDGAAGRRQDRRGHHVGVDVAHVRTG